MFIKTAMWNLLKVNNNRVNQLKSRRAIVWAMLVCAVTVSICTGCRFSTMDRARTAARIFSLGSTPVAEVKKLPRPAMLGPIRRVISSKPVASERTQLFLRQNNLESLYMEQPFEVIKILRKHSLRAPSMPLIHTLAELSDLEGRWALRTGNDKLAPELFATAIVHSYQFLFDDKLDIQRNAYDPQFRNICDIYNRSLEELVRIITKSGQLEPGMIYQAGDDELGMEFNVELVGRWQGCRFDKFELVSDYEMRGLENDFHTHGLGVPLIAVYKEGDENRTTFDKYYPPNLSVPMTAFFELQPSGSSRSRWHGTLKLIDPLERTVVKTETREAPLESDLSVPLAYHLNDPILNTNLLSTASMLNPKVASEYYGVYMMEPYDPKKIPVVMVHGLWSSPVTWMNMFNDLRGHKWIRDHYQFWFYMYPTGQPFWLSAHDMREDLAQLRRDVDPGNTSDALQQMILVGHSMGGLVSKMQVVDSRDDFWSIVSDEQIDSLNANAAIKEHLNDVFYFDSNPGISRLITIATPHHGSRYANNATRWLSHKIFTVPKIMETTYSEFVQSNKSVLRNTRHLTIPTSIDSLAPDSPFIAQLLEAPTKVRQHNVIGVVSKTAFTGGQKAVGGDGVVSRENARLENAESEVVVNEEHMRVHQHPKTILEVKRILVENLVETGRVSDSDKWVFPASYSQQELNTNSQVKPAAPRSDRAYSR